MAAGSRTFWASPLEWFSILRGPPLSAKKVELRGRISPAGQGFFSQQQADSGARLHLCPNLALAGLSVAPCGTLWPSLGYTAADAAKVPHWTPVSELEMSVSAEHKFTPQSPGGQIRARRRAPTSAGARFLAPIRRSHHQWRSEQLQYFTKVWPQAPAAFIMRLQFPANLVKLAPAKFLVQPTFDLTVRGDSRDKVLRIEARPVGTNFPTVQAASLAVGILESLMGPSQAREPARGPRARPVPLRRNALGFWRSRRGDVRTRARQTAALLRRVVTPTREHHRLQVP